MRPTLKSSHLNLEFYNRKFYTLKIVQKTQQQNVRKKIHFQIMKKMCRGLFEVIRGNKNIYFGPDLFYSSISAKNTPEPLYTPFCYNTVLVVTRIRVKLLFLYNLYILL